MKKNIEALIGECSGCSACSVICPVDAIQVKLDEKGFYKAFINSDKCVNCGLCTDVCMKKQIHNANDIINGQAYAAQSKNLDVIKTCTSGGIAYEMSVHIINDNNLVVGVEYDYETNSARTIIVDNMEDLEKLKGSKYIQSYTEEAFNKVIDIAKKDTDKRFLAWCSKY